jgi:predicted GNAT family acetyltransferase
MGEPLLLDVDAQNSPARKAYEALGWKDFARTGEAGNEQIRLIGP